MKRKNGKRKHIKEAVELKITRSKTKQKEKARVRGGKGKSERL